MNELFSKKTFEKNDELQKLKAKLETSESSRLAGEQAVALDEARQRLKKLYNAHE